MPSTFTSSVVGSAYYYRGRGSARTVCRSTGYSLLFSLQSILVETLGDLGPLPSAGGASIAADQVGVIGSGGGGWDEMTLRGLSAFLTYSRQPSYAASVAQDLLRRGTLSERTMKAALWAISSRGFDDAGNRTYGIGSPDEIAFDDDTVFPTFGSVPPRPANNTIQVGGGDCSSIAEGASAGDPITTTATFGVAPALVILAIGIGVFGMAQATARQNPWDRWIWKRDVR